METGARNLFADGLLDAAAQIRQQRDARPNRDRQIDPAGPRDYMRQPVRAGGATGAALRFRGEQPRLEGSQRVVCGTSCPDAAIDVAINGRQVAGGQMRQGRGIEGSRRCRWTVLPNGTIAGLRCVRHGGADVSAPECHPRSQNVVRERLLVVAGTRRVEHGIGLPEMATPEQASGKRRPGQPGCGGGVAGPCGGQRRAQHRFSFVQTPFVEPGVTGEHADLEEERIVPRLRRERPGVDQHLPGVARLSTPQQRCGEGQLASHGVMPIVPARQAADHRPETTLRRRMAPASEQVERVGEPLPVRGHIAWRWPHPRGRRRQGLAVDRRPLSGLAPPSAASVTADHWRPP